MAALRCQEHFSLHGRFLALVLRHHTEDLVALRRPQVHALQSVLTQHGVILTVGAVGEAGVSADLSARVEPTHGEALILQDVGLALLVVSHGRFTVEGLVRTRKKEKVVIVVFVVVEVDPVLRLALQRWEKRIVAVLVAMEAAKLTTAKLTVFHTILKSRRPAGQSSRTLL